MRTLLLLNVFAAEEIGDRIKQAREEAGLRQEDLADLIGTSTRQVQNYESGASKQYAKLKGIADATGVRVEWLLHGDQEATTAPGGRLEAMERHLESIATSVAELALGQAELLDIARGAEPGSQSQA